MAKIVWRQTALQQIADIYDYIFADNPKAAIDVANAILAAGNSLNTFPRRGRPVGNTKMREILTLYPYVIRYRLSGNTVFILRIRHNARRPTTP